ncbi:hypothetical protein Tco_0482449 [Tanacetum coccineum]
MPTVPDNEDDEPERRGTTLLSMDPEKETALCKALVRISEDSVVGNSRKEKGFWVEVVKDEEDEAEDGYQKKEKKDEAEEVCRSHPIGKDEAKRKDKVVTSLRSSTTSFDVGASAKLMANRYVMTNDPYNATKGMSRNSRTQK